MQRNNEWTSYLHDIIPGFDPVQEGGGLLGFLVFLNFITDHQWEFGDILNHVT